MWKANQFHLSKVRTYQPSTVGPKSFGCCMMRLKSLLFVDTKQVLGIGADAKVFLAQAKKSRHFYALKRFPKRRVLEHTSIPRLNNEMRALLSFNSPFIVHMHGSFQDDSYVYEFASVVACCSVACLTLPSTIARYFLLDFCGGGQLFTLLNKVGRLSADEVKFYVAELLLALEHVHNRAFVYRHLKPENIVRARCVLRCRGACVSDTDERARHQVLTSTGHVRLIDFGVCKEPNASGLLFDLAGSAQYQAPEMLSAEVQTHGYTRAVDFWALGCLMLELFTGKVRTR